jgi:hypothetical protein
MSVSFACRNGQNVSWTSVCDGSSQCKDGSDEQNCTLFEEYFSLKKGKEITIEFSLDDYIILNLYFMSYNALGQGFLYLKCPFFSRKKS